MIRKIKKLFTPEVKHRNADAINLGTQKGSVFFEEELKWFLGVEDDWLNVAAKEYRECPDAWHLLSCLKSSSRKTDGVAKTLDVAEGFSVWCFVKYFKPKVIVELGSQFGISARLWKQALIKYVPDHELYLCDLIDRRKYITDDECVFLKGDAKESLCELLSNNSIDVLINDAHPYDLIMWSLEAGIKGNVRHFAFHDIGANHPSRAPFKRGSYSLSKEEKIRESLNWGDCGLWERHGMGEVFDEGILDDDAVETERWKIQIFDSFLGYGFVQNKVVVARA